jgi:hypothetical protein
MLVEGIELREHGAADTSSRLVAVPGPSVLRHRGRSTSSLTHHPAAAVAAVFLYPARDAALAPTHNNAG